MQTILYNHLPFATPQTGLIAGLVARTDTYLKNRPAELSFAWFWHVYVYPLVIARDS